MASCAMFFIIRRYGIGSWGKKWLALGLLFITLSTMHARFMLDAHTISATLAGALLLRACLRLAPP